jgi:large subunit ribosomal protein L30
MAEKVKIRLKKSEIGSTQRQRQTLRGLGLRTIGDVRELEKSVAVVGMIKKVAHLVVVEES